MPMVKVNDKNNKTASLGNEQSSMEGDGSFVVLERSTLQDHGQSRFTNGSHLQNSHVPSGSTSMTSQPTENVSSSYIPVSTLDLSPEEIQKKLQEVLQENLELKETLHQNNLAMKQQFNTLVMWQDEVFKVHQSHKEKFQETKELILKLRTENTELKNYLEKCGNSPDSQLKAENAKLKGQIAELQQKLSAPMPRRDNPHSAPSKKEEELTDLVKQLNTQLESVERSRRQLALEVESLQARLQRHMKEYDDVKMALTKQTQRCAVVEQKNAELVQKVEQCGSYVMIEKQEPQVSNEMQALRTALEEARSQIQELRNQLEDEKQNKCHLMQLNQQMQHQKQFLEELQKKVQQQHHYYQQLRYQEPAQSSAAKKERECFRNLLFHCEEQIKELNSIQFRQTERYVNLDKSLQKIASVPQTWHPQHAREMEQLIKCVTLEQACSEEMKAHFLKLLIDFQNLISEWESNLIEQKNIETFGAENRRIDAKGFSEKLDNLLAQVLCKDEEIKENEREIKELKDKIKKLELENEAITILKAQVEVYQSDFNAEREARENLAGEKEQLADDLRHLQRRNQQLLDDLETYQRDQFETMQNRSSGGSNWNTIGNIGRTSAPAVTPDRSQRQSPRVEPSPPRVYEEDIPPPKEYVCPMCKMSFRQLGLLEYHVETCLDS